MRKACLVVDSVYQKNQIFEKNSYLNRDNCLKFFHELKNVFADRQVDLQTQDCINLDDADFIIYNEIPTQLPNSNYKNKSYLLLFESELIRPDNWNIESHSHFNKIFTWNDQYIDNVKYFKFNFTHFGKAQFNYFAEKTQFCTLIAGNKYVNHPLELYSKRIEVIRWFEKYRPHFFNFYGMGWDLYTFKIPVVSKIFNRIKILRAFFADTWPLYNGAVENKIELLKKYKFSICYENAKDISGYITEKIFDSLSAGCIPVYWGAPNIKDFVPENCFIDKRLFSSYEELFNYLSKMTEDEYNQRLISIEEYLKSDLHKLFEPKHNAIIVAENILLK